MVFLQPLEATGIGLLIIGVMLTGVPGAYLLIDSYRKSCMDTLAKCTYVILIIGLCLIFSSLALLAYSWEP